MKPRYDELSLPISDPKSTRLHSSHVENSYAVFCLKKKKHQHNRRNRQQQRKLHVIYRLTNCYSAIVEYVQAYRGLYFFSELPPDLTYTPLSADPPGSG